MLEIQKKLIERYGDKYRTGTTRKCEKCGGDFSEVEMYAMDKEDWIVVDRNCPRCLVEYEDEEIRQRANQQIIKRKIEEHKYFSSIPQELRNVSFEDYQPRNDSQKQALDICQSFANDELEQTTLFFQGDTGLGKSHLAYSIFDQKINEQKLAIFIDVPKLLKKIRKSYQDNSNLTEDEILSKINNCDLLVLDDVGAEYVKDNNGFENWAGDILFQIVNGRQGKKNVYTTNFTSEFLNQKYGMMSKRILSRMMYNAKVVKFAGDDYRLRGLD